MVSVVQSNCRTAVLVKNNKRCSVVLDIGRFGYSTQSSQHGLEHRIIDTDTV